MCSGDRLARKGRGAAFNPPNRFESTHHLLELEQVEDDADYLDGLSRPPTEFIADRSRSVIARNDSPDVGFEVSVNPYRGCEHGCIYCYARPTHEFLGYSSGLDFETKLLVKHDAPELLRRELMSPKWEPKVLALSGVTDPYQPVERRLGLTRRCLEVMAEFRQAVSIVTKNRLVTRDIDLLGELARHEAAGVFLSITTLDPELARRARAADEPAGGSAGGDPGPDPGRHPDRRVDRTGDPRAHRARDPVDPPGRRGLGRTPGRLHPAPPPRPGRGASSKTGSIATGPRPRRKSSAGSAPCAVAGSTTRGSATGCAARAPPPT